MISQLDVTVLACMQGFAWISSSMFLISKEGKSRHSIQANTTFETGDFHHFLVSELWNRQLPCFNFLSLIFKTFYILLPYHRWWVTISNSESVIITDTNKISKWKWKLVDAEANELTDVLNLHFSMLW